MKIGVDSYSYHRYFGEIYPGQKDPGTLWTLKDFLIEMKPLPAEGLALETCFLPPEEETIRNFDSITLEVMFAWGHPDGFMGSPPGEAISEVERYLTLSKKLNLKVMRIVGSSISHFKEPHGPQIELTLQRLQKILPIAESWGIKVAIENHGDFYLTELYQIVEQINSPFLGITLDTGNCLRLKEDPVDAVRLFKEKIFAIHAKDLAPVPGADPGNPMSLACVPAGEGVTDFKSLMTALMDVNYTGMILTEISRLHPDYEMLGETEIIRRSLSYLSRQRERGQKEYGGKN